MHRLFIKLLTYWCSADVKQTQYEQIMTIRKRQHIGEISSTEIHINTDNLR